MKQLGGSGPPQMILVRIGIIYLIFSTLNWLVLAAEKKKDVWFLPKLWESLRKTELLGQNRTPWGGPDPPQLFHIFVFQPFPQVDSFVNAFYRNLKKK